MCVSNSECGLVGLCVLFVCAQAKDMVTKVLELATEHADNPDLRDR